MENHKKQMIIIIQSTSLKTIGKIILQKQNYKKVCNNWRTAKRKIN